MVSDPNDMATELEEAHRQAAIAKARLAAKEEADEDEFGRYCLDCGDVIPPDRVAAVQAVRCVPCASAREKRKRLGIGNAPGVDDE